jgi:hypothetical protein
MSGYPWNAVFLLACSIVAGCAEPILTQSVPVSSTPLGAAVYTDGQLAGHTPLTLDLARNRDHLVTLVQPGYRQANVLVQRQYLANDVLMRSMQAGINTGSFFNDPAMGMNAAINAMQQEKDSGAAYQLAPPALVITMLPAGTRNPPAPTSIPPYNGAPIYPDLPPAAAIGGVAAFGGVPDYHHEHTWSKTTSTTTTHSFIRPDGATETQSTTTSKGSGSTFGLGYEGSGGGASGTPSGMPGGVPGFTPPSMP